MKQNLRTLNLAGIVAIALGTALVGFAANDHQTLLKLSKVRAGVCGGCGPGTPNCNVDNSASGVAEGPCPEARVGQTVQNCDGSQGLAKWAGRSQAGTSASSVEDLPDNPCLVMDAYKCVRTRTPGSGNSTIFVYNWQESSGDCGMVSTCRAVSPTTSPECTPTPTPTPEPTPE